jgi:DNA-binding transcriptional LysR family regulator
MRAYRFGDMEAVLAVARHGSFRKAATDLGISTSALSQVIAAIEAQLGVLLFNRTTRSVSLTVSGGRFCDVIEPALVVIRETAEQLSSQNGILSGNLRINASVRAMRQAMPMLLAFMERYPAIELELKGDDKLRDIVSDGFDVGIRLANTVAKDMIAVPFGDLQRHVVIGSRAYFGSHAVPLKPEDVLNHQCVRFRSSNRAVRPWEFAQRARKSRIDPPGSLTVDSSYLAREAVLNDYGLAYCSEVYVSADIAEGTVLSVLANWIPKSERLCLYFPNRRYLPGNLRALVDFAKSWDARA